MTADEISREYDLSLSEIHAALAYYFDHLDAINQEIMDSEAFASSLRESRPSKIPDSLRRMSGAA